MKKKCRYCNSLFYTRPSHYDKKTYCSRKCTGEDYKTRFKGSKNPNYRSAEKKTGICRICGDPFLFLYRKDKKLCGKKACFRENSRISNTKYPDRQARPKIKRTQKPQVKICVCGSTKDYKSKVCRNCHKKVKTYTSCVQCGATIEKKTKKTKFCNMACVGEHRKVSGLRENNPNWRGGLKPKNQRQRNHVVYKEWRKKVFERDNYTCQDCGQVGGILHSHHIKPFSQHEELRTDVSNGLTLCVSCHNIYHPKLKFSLKRNQPRKEGNNDESN